MASRALSLAQNSIKENVHQSLHEAKTTLINKIYDAFESIDDGESWQEGYNQAKRDFAARTCDSCGRYGEIWFRDCTVSGCEHLRISVTKTFSCSAYKVKIK